MRTLSSSPCQLKLGVDLSHYSLRPYSLMFLIITIWIFPPFNTYDSNTNLEDPQCNIYLIP